MESLCAGLAGDDLDPARVNRLSGEFDRLGDLVIDLFTERGLFAPA